MIYKQQSGLSKAQTTLLLVEVLIKFLAAL